MIDDSAVRNPVGHGQDGSSRRAGAVERVPMTPERRTSAGSSLRDGQAPEDSGRRAEILETAASLIATSGLRTSMHDIAGAAGIKTGSLYHHFESKEALLIELLRRYHTDLDRIAERTLHTLDEPNSGPGFAQIADLGVAVARCGVAHRAALQISMYDTPSSNPELIEWARRRPVAILEAMRQTLRASRWSGYLRSDLDLPVLSDRICQTMLQVGLDVVRHNASPEQVATLLCRILIEGMATGRPTDAELDRSSAFAAADRAIRAWTDDGDSTDKAARVRAVARAEFGRRGYEGTTVRDIAAAAGLGHGTVFRLIGSKEELLASIMRSFGEKIEAGTRDVLRTDATSIEKLDALAWVNTNALARFGDEFRIQLAWMRQIPPDAPNPSTQFAPRLRQTKALLAEGIAAGEIRITDAPKEMMARCVIGLKWVPENILRELGTGAALFHIRDTMLRGVAVSRP
jgi:AcrR family transcriptional regulator